MELLKELWRFLVAIVVVVSLGVWGTLYAAKREAEVFNKFTTGPKATAQDALWAELRVDAGASQSK